MTELYKYFGLLAPLMVAFTMVYIFRKWPAARKSTFSTHIAKDKKSFALFRAINLLATFLYYPFLIMYLGPIYQMPAVYYVMLWVAFVCQIIFTFVPSSTGVARRVHQISAGFVGIAMLLLPVLFLLFGSGLSSGKTIALKLFIVTCLAMATIFLVQKERHEQNLLVFEVTYFVLFWVMMAGLAYL